MIVKTLFLSLAHRLGQELYVVGSQDEKEIKVSELLQNVLKTSSNLLDPTQIFAWRDLPDGRRANFASSLMLGVEENAVLLAETINNEKNLIEATNNILASIRIMRARDVKPQEFPHLETVRWEEDSKMEVSDATLHETSVNGAVRIIFFLYNNLESIMPGLKGKFVNSKIIGAVTPKGRDLALARPVADDRGDIPFEYVFNRRAIAFLDEVQAAR